MRRRFAIVRSFAVAALALAACNASSADISGGAAAITGDASDNGSLAQGWTAADTTHYEHTSDGSGVFPYHWLVSLEQADSSDMFLTDDNVRRYGFIPSPKSSDNPDGIPVGLAKQPNGDQVGTTCSACHEGELTFRGRTMRIHGGQGSAQNLDFFGAAYAALGKTILDPFKFKRFADRVQKRDVDATSLALLLQAANSTVATGLKLLASELATSGTPPVANGPYRTDAVGGGINRLSGAIKLSNLRQVNAPVSMPHLWDTPRFDWVEYNGAFRQPMARNVISALARGATIQFVDDGKPGLPNGVDVIALHDLESSVARIRPPRWPEDILGPIDREKAARGQQIYAEKVGCGTCHDPATSADGTLQIKMISLEDIGTDPMQAKNWAGRSVDMNGDLGLGVVPVTEFARMTTQGVIDRDFGRLGIGAADVGEMTGDRPNEFRAPLAYRARPLQGSWATGPYLHNGSVPTLAQLLLPASQRAAKFQLGSKEVDPVGVGIATEGDFTFDTRIDGNRNGGHEGSRYGTDLSLDERSDLLEYLKTL